MRHLFHCNLQLLGIDQVSQKMISNLRAALFFCIQRFKNICGILIKTLHLKKNTNMIFHRYNVSMKEQLLLYEISKRQSLEIVMFYYITNSTSLKNAFYICENNKQ